MKVVDGNCWMIENLRLETASTVGNNQTDPSVTNASLSQGYGTSTAYGNFTGLATVESSNFTKTNPSVANSLYSTDGTTTNTIQGGSSSYYYARMPRYNNTNTSARASSPTTNTDVAMYSYGNYYTWAAAMASVKQYTSPTSTDDEGKTSETANTSLCPTGWRLPYGRNTGNGATSGGFSYLNTQLGGTRATSNSSTDPTGTVMSTRWRSFPNNFLYSGCFLASSAYSRGSLGYYWSSTAYGSSYSLTLYLGSSTVGSGTGYNDKFSSSIRCVAGS